jgi:hypothetical protein
MKMRVPFTEDRVKKYLDDCIVLFQVLRKALFDEKDILKAEAQLDILRLVRNALFGETEVKL